jgi:hypothetical protein
MEAVETHEALQLVQSASGPSSEPITSFQYDIEMLDT